MTPEEARHAIHDAEGLRAYLPAYCWRALETIANMHEEWGVSWDDDPSDSSRDWGFPTRAAAERWEKANRHYGPGRGYAVRRYIIEPEVTE